MNEVPESTKVYVAGLVAELLKHIGMRITPVQKNLQSLEAEMRDRVTRIESKLKPLESRQIIVLPANCDECRDAHSSYRDGLECCDYTFGDYGCLRLRYDAMMPMPEGN